MLGHLQACCETTCGTGRTGPSSDTIRTWGHEAKIMISLSTNRRKFEDLLCRFPCLRRSRGIQICWKGECTDRHGAAPRCHRGREVMRSYLTLSELGALCTFGSVSALLAAGTHSSRVCARLARPQVHAMENQFKHKLQYLSSTSSSPTVYAHRARPA